MCSIMVKEKAILTMAKGIIPKHYRIGKNKKYESEEEKYEAIKNEIKNCENPSKKNHLHILFKCSLDSKTNDTKVFDFVSSLLSALGILSPILLFMLTILLNTLSQAEGQAIIITDIIFSTIKGVQMVYLWFGTMMIFLILYGIILNWAKNRSRNRIVYILEIFEVVNNELNS